MLPWTRKCAYRHLHSGLGKYLPSPLALPTRRQLVTVRCDYRLGTWEGLNRKRVLFGLLLEVPRAALEIWRRLTESPEFFLVVEYH